MSKLNYNGLWIYIEDAVQSVLATWSSNAFISVSSRGDADHGISTNGSGRKI